MAKDWIQLSDKRQSMFGVLELWLVSHMDFWLPRLKGDDARKDGNSLWVYN